MKSIKAYIIVLTTVLLCSCTGNVIYSHYENIPTDGWHQDSALQFTFSPQETCSGYEWVVGIRHNEHYPYQNIWLFADLYTDSVLIMSDTLEYYLANRRGEWLGNGFGRLKDMPGLWMSNTEMPANTVYRIELRQGMRDEVLTGVEAVGLMVERQ